MTRKPVPFPAVADLGQRWRFAGVLVAVLLLAVAQPLMSGLFNEQSSFDGFSSLLIVTVALLGLPQREYRRTALSLGLAAFLGIWLSHGIGGTAGRALSIAAQLLAAVFFAFALYGILRGIFVKRVSGNAIFAAACGYLLLGIIWSVLYSAVETAFPGSFRMPPADASNIAVARPEPSDLSYFSFVTLATVGYGDVTPITRLARTLAWMEAITGQFYLATLVAGLVGFKVAQAKIDEPGAMAAGDGRGG